MEGGHWTKEGWLQTDYQCKHRSGTEIDTEEEQAQEDTGGSRYDLPRADPEKRMQTHGRSPSRHAAGASGGASRFLDLTVVPPRDVLVAGGGLKQMDSDGAMSPTGRGGAKSNKDFELAGGAPTDADLAEGGDGSGGEEEEEDAALVMEPAYSIDMLQQPAEMVNRQISGTSAGGGGLESPTKKKAAPGAGAPTEPVAVKQMRRVNSNRDISEELDEENLDMLRHVAVEETPVTEETARDAAELDKCVQRRRKYLSTHYHKSPTASHSPVAPAESVKASPTPPFLPFSPSKILDGKVVATKEYPPDLKDHQIRFEGGVFVVDSPFMGEYRAEVSCGEFYQDLRRTMKVVGTASVNSTATKRLMLLEAKFKMYLLLNEEKEYLAQKINPHRDFYNVRKVDTHIHHSAAMHQKHLLRYIKKKLRVDGDRIVIFRDGKELTLTQVFQSLRMTAYDLSLDMLDVHADNSTLHRFDRFNLKYNPCGSSRLREIFLKTDNRIQGVYLAGITQELFQDYTEAKYQMSELRLSIYGRNMNEWDKLAQWIVKNKLYCDNVRWMIQVPRLYHIHRKTVPGMNSFSDMLRNIFSPLFEVTKDPSSHPELHLFLQQIVGFDSVDDESLGEIKIWRQPPLSDDWNNEINPPYSYYAYHMWANINVLNRFRRERGFGEFSFRPHCGEAGELDHVVAAFLCSESVNHGITMRRSPSLQYLFYLEQIGLAMSPMSNNALFLQYDRNPFHLYFKRGLNVSLSTDDPLQFHFTKEPLIEEYGMAKQVWKYSTVDLCEIARNSVLQSGFEDCVKAHWIGPDFRLKGHLGNNISRTNVPDIRLEFRHNTLTEERAYVARSAAIHYEGIIHPIKSPSHGPQHSQRALAAAKGLGGPPLMRPLNSGYYPQPPAADQGERSMGSGGGDGEGETKLEGAVDKWLRNEEGGAREAVGAGGEGKRWLSVRGLLVWQSVLVLAYALQSTSVVSTAAQAARTRAYTALCAPPPPPTPVKKARGKASWGAKGQVGEDGLEEGGVGGLCNVLARQGGLGELLLYPALAVQCIFIGYTFF